MGRASQEIRSQLKIQMQETQVTSFLNRVRQSVLKNGKPTMGLYGDSSTLPVYFNNLTKPGILQVADFSPAVVRQGKDCSTRNNPIGTAVMYLHRSLNKISGLFDSFHVLGKDHAGNYWLMVTMLERAWNRLDDDIMSLAKC
jgi:hypothetical protein